MAINHGSETDDSLLDDDEERLSRAPISACMVFSLFRSAATRSGRTTLPSRSKQFCAAEHQVPASGRNELRERIVASKSLPTSSGNRYCSSGISGSMSGMSRKSGSDLRPFLSGRLHTALERSESGRTATAGKGTASRRVYMSHFAGMSCQLPHLPLQQADDRGTHGVSYILGRSCQTESWLQMGNSASLHYPAGR